MKSIDSGVTIGVVGKLKTPRNHLIELSAVGCNKGVGPVDKLVGEDT
jgi:hypothetical protein